jgi:chromosome segregation ATPase
LAASLEHEKAQNQNHEEHILELNAATDENQKRLGELAASLEHEKAQNQNHEEHIRELNEAKDESDKRLAELAASLEHEKVQNQNHEEHIRELSAGKDESDKQFAELGASLKRQKEQNASLKGSNQQKDDRISELESVLRDLPVLADGSASREGDVDAKNVKKVVVDAMD